DTEETYSYNKRGFLHSIAYLDGSTDEVEYDVAGRVLAVSAKEHSLRFEYDPRGYPSKAARNGVLVRYEYDLEGRPVLEVQDGVSISRQFDAAGNCTALSVDGLGVRRFEYDLRQRLVGVEDFNHERLQITYDLRDRCTAVVLTPELRLEYQYLPENRIDLARLRGAGEKWEIRYVYDRAGRVKVREGP